MRRYGAFEVARERRPAAHGPRAGGRARGRAPHAAGARLHAAPRSRASANIVPVPSPDPDAEGRRPVGVEVDGDVVRGFPTPSGRLEFYSSTLKAWGWPEYALPTYIRSHVHPQSLEQGEVPLDPDLPAAGADPHPQRQRQVARRDRAHQPALDPPERTPRRLGRRDRRPGARRDAHRLLRGEGLGHRGDPARRRRVQPPHGPLEARGARPASDDGDREPAPRGHALAAATRAAASSRSTRPTPTRRASGGPTPASTRT